VAAVKMSAAVTACAWRLSAVNTSRLLRAVVSLFMGASMVLQWTDRPPGEKIIAVRGYIVPLYYFFNVFGGTPGSATAGCRRHARTTSISPEVGGSQR